MPTLHKHTVVTTSKKLSISLGLGALVASGAVLSGAWKYSPLAGWDSAALIYVAWTWVTIRHMNADDTKSHAINEDPSRALADILLISASMASLVAVAVLIAQAGKSHGLAKIAEILLGLFSVIVSWLVIQIIHTLKYAKFYFDGTPGGINFNQDILPRYTDFAYMAFTLGMTFQVSDTSIETPEIRYAALKHTLISYVFGTVIIAATINTIAGLGK